MKVVEKIRESDGKIVFSLEFMPPRSKNGVEEVVNKIARVVAHNPAFCDITWRAGAGNEELTLDIANKMQNMLHVETMMHLTCVNTPVDRIDHALSTIKSNGIKNVLALRGDPPSAGTPAVEFQDDFTCALDLVKYIRAKYGDYFGITVAGYPEAHQDVIGSDGVATPEAYQKDLAYLKRKVDAGADVIITQLFFDVDIFLKFVNDCREIGITCPIVPGIFLISKYSGFVRMITMCKTKIPDEITAALEPIKDNKAAVLNYGIHLGTEMCKKLLANGIKTLHMYTINNEKSALAILTNLGLIGAAPVSRPISRENHSKDWIPRTTETDQYPNGNSANGSHKALAKCEDLDAAC